MENDNTKYISLSGQTTGFIVFIVFLVLKLTHVWEISWFWVFFPLWIPVAVALGIVAIALIICGIVSLIED